MTERKMVITKKAKKVKKATGKKTLLKKYTPPAYVEPLKASSPLQAAASGISDFLDAQFDPIQDLAGRLSGVTHELREVRGDLGEYKAHTNHLAVVSQTERNNTYKLGKSTRNLQIGLGLLTLLVGVLAAVVAYKV